MPATQSAQGAAAARGKRKKKDKGKDKRCKPGKPRGEEVVLEVGNIIPNELGEVRVTVKIACKVVVKDAVLPKHKGFYPPMLVNLGERVVVVATWNGQRDKKAFKAKSKPERVRIELKNGKKLLVNHV